ncbi:MAG: 16S rRNA (cytosine(1402)-N(4))-methyltransferase [Alphaproteobacteria bacterium 32-64-14]|nr:MAG: 16S rRNA (cytosine(1402)-N(4))-methyltransferase [Alphaproteobacteria bacterium 32-64-14]
MNAGPISPHAGTHVPVLAEQVIHALAPVDGAVMVDGTYGGGGYARAALAVANITLIAIDRDPEAMERAWAHAGKDPRLVPAPGRFGELEAIVRASGHEHVDGVMLDLGVSSFQIDEAERGFSFMRDGPLDMRMGKNGPSAADAVNRLTEGELADIFHLLGEEPAARRMARFVVQRRRSQPFETTLDLADELERSVGGRRGKPTHPATRAFQALRMWVNDETGELVRALAASEHVLKPGGRLAIVTFHSIEDRIVKLFLRSRSGNEPGASRHIPGTPRGADPTFEVLQRKAIEADAAELAANPRARSARLRWALRTEAPPWKAAPGEGFRLPNLAQLEGAA